jgi:uncharacterized surface protein with fasciclin (FAS1) repeats
MKLNLRSLLVTLLAGFSLLTGHVSAQMISVQGQSTVNRTVFAYLKAHTGKRNRDALCYSGTKPANTYSCLVRALESTGLKTTLSEAGSYTLFAPSDAAFKKLAQGMSQANWTALFKDAAKLKAVLSYHVLPEKRTLANLWTSANASGDFTSKTLEGSNVFLAFAQGGTNTTIKLSNQQGFGDIANVTGTTILAKNGTIIPVDRVLAALAR